MLKDDLPFTAIRNLPKTHFTKGRIATQPCGILQCKPEYPELVTKHVYFAYKAPSL